jgi:ABC-2 type transport system permease protein
VRKESTRFLRIWKQTLLPPIINQSLYFVIFGSFIGAQIDDIDGVSYMAFIIPGLILMAIISNSFANVVSSFFGSKFQRSIEELLVSPTPKWVILAGYTLGGMMRGLIIGTLVWIVSMFFVKQGIHSPAIVIVFGVLTSLLFSLAGFTVGIFAKKFDDVSFVPTFILTPLTYLGGVFYSIGDLPQVWQIISRFNPIVYMIDGFRYGFYGRSDLSVITSTLVVLLFCVVLVCLNLYFLKIGKGMKS